MVLDVPIHTSLPGQVQLLWGWAPKPPCPIQTFHIPPRTLISELHPERRPLGEPIPSPPSPALLSCRYHAGVCTILYKKPQPPRGDFNTNLSSATQMIPGWSSRSSPLAGHNQAVGLLAAVPDWFWRCRCLATSCITLHNSCSFEMCFFISFVLVVICSLFPLC